MPLQFFKYWLVSWSLTSLFSTNMAISETNSSTGKPYQMIWADFKPWW